MHLPDGFGFLFCFCFFSRVWKSPVQKGFNLPVDLRCFSPCAGPPASCQAALYSVLCTIKKFAFSLPSPWSIPLSCHQWSKVKVRRNFLSSPLPSLSSPSLPISIPPLPLPSSTSPHLFLLPSLSPSPPPTYLAFQWTVQLRAVCGTVTWRQKYIAALWPHVLKSG